MNLELLPNEILLNLFNCLNGIDLLHAFYDLNSRFNLLLYKQFRAYRFDFSCFSKRQFDMICQQHLPSITDRVLTLTLSDNEDTPGQINLFLSYQPSFRQFTHLKSLSICFVHSYETLIKIAHELHHLSNLTHLKLNSSSFGSDQVDLQSIVNNIWSLPKLTHYHCDTCGDPQKYFTLPTKVSTFLEYVYISGLHIKWNQINRLFEYTPRLKCLHIFITSSEDDDDYKSSPILTLIDLKIDYFRMSDTLKLISLLKNVPNLRCLNISLSDKLINGYQWEQIIRNYLPKLKVFELKMNNKLSVDQNIQERADELINSFRSSFWTDEHQWFIRCFTYGKTIHLQTLSKIFYHYKRQLPDSWKSTYPDDDHQKLWNTIQRVHRYTLFEQPTPSCIRLHNVHFLSIALPIHDKFWSIVPSLKNLICLIVSSYTDTYQSQLQGLFNHAPHLHYLYISQDASLCLQMSLLKYTHVSVRHLYLQEYNYSFNEEECIILTHSSLGVQCELLTIQVKNRESIIILVKNMINLRVLHIECDDDEYFKHLSLIENINEFPDGHISNKDDLVQWLKDNLSSTYFISRDPEFVNYVRLWIQ